WAAIPAATEPRQQPRIPSGAPHGRRFAFGASKRGPETEATPNRASQPATPWEMSPVSGIAEGSRLREEADARLTDRMRRRGFGSGANFALPWAVDYVKRQQFRTWKGGRVV